MKAFPTPTFSISEEARVTSIGGEGGMELRDYFAAKAMQSIMASDRYTGVIGVNRYQEITAESAYKMADAMMRARQS
jgi:hypothetical protein